MGVSGGEWGWVWEWARQVEWERGEGEEGEESGGEYKTDPCRMPLG